MTYQLDLAEVDAIIDEQKRQHDLGKCNSAECVWCDEPPWIERSMVATHRPQATTSTHWKGGKKRKKHRRR